MKIFIKIKKKRVRRKEKIMSRYEEAKKIYESFGIDTEAAMERLAKIPVSVHCWQGDDVIGFDGSDSLSGGIQTTGNYPGRARTPEELFADMTKAFSLMPGKKRVNVHACYALLGEDKGKVDRDEYTYKYFEPWVKWAKENEIHHKVIDFLCSRRDFFMGFDPKKDDLAFPTPRSWEMVSKILKVYDGNEKEAHAMIAGCVGAGVASEFLMFCSVYHNLPSVEDIFDNKNPAVPTETDSLFALVSSMIAYARENKDDLRRIGNAIAYSERFSPDFSVAFMKELLNIEPEYRKKLITTPSYTKWMERRGRLLNGII